ncbi:hypothetical protein TWF694_006049 [Orbilia ellipsospora]|uniref:Nucleoside phosphorylase domain-containing protein n=1 Tax=Orbilia ellipsospora TaxID=2528407 RepID=A0AAV9WR35_9PEZI
MASPLRQAQRGPSARPIAATLNLRSSRPDTPSRSPLSNQDSFDKNAIVAAATEAAAVLREQCNSLKKQFKHNTFLTLLSQQLLDVKERLDAADSLTDARLSRLLLDLERLAKWPTYKKPKVPDSQINRSFILALNEKPQYARDCIKRLAESMSNRGSEERKAFLKTFKMFANIKREPLGPEFSDLTSSSSKSSSNDETTECLQNLYSILCKTCLCAASASESDFKVNVAPNVVAAPGSDGMLIEIFFLHRHSSNEENEWKETQIRIFLERSDSLVSRAKAKSQRFATNGEKIRDFCRLIRSRELGRLNLSASNRGLFDDGLELTPNKNDLSLRTPSISLADVLASTNLRSDPQRKLLLSYLLAKAVWQFYDSDWMGEAWTKHSIHFMQQCLDKMQRKAQLYHKPFISADLRGSIAHSDHASSRRSHIFPKILALGVMLLEIELGQDIEDRYSNLVRENLYQSVVVPLKNLFSFSWYCPDGSPESFEGPMNLTLSDGLVDNGIFEPDPPNRSRATTPSSLPQGLNNWPPPPTMGRRNLLSLGGQCDYEDTARRIPEPLAIDGKSEHDYTIGWICAIAIELAAVTAIMDEEYQTLPMSPSDNDIYKFGRIGNHSIVIACLPAGSYGNISAAAVGTRMKARFPNLRFGLMVGIGGGIPYDEIGLTHASSDLHLGDVVVGTPTGNSGGTIQYDFGKTVEGGTFIHTGSLRKPPDILLSAVSSIQAKHPRSLRERLGERVSRAQEADDRLSHPGEGNDYLFDANYEHTKNSISCRLCDKSKLLNRRPRKDNHPYVHYGIIASGGQVVRHGPTRDKISSECRALCFEMEAAGLVNVIPCLVIRGISDYSDSHKSDLWQGYAAATAAAFAKELLLEIPPISL